jgi:hypothetical protein
VPRHGSGQQVQRSSAGSIPHDRTKILQICSSHPRPLHRPRQSASRHPPVVTNRPATDRVRRDPRLIQQPFHHPPACWSASTPFTHLIRGTQIPIAKPQHPRPPPAVSSLGGLRTPAPRAGRATVMGPPSANLHRNGTRCPHTYRHKPACRQANFSVYFGAAQYKSTPGNFRQPGRTNLPHGT